MMMRSAWRRLFLLSGCARHPSASIGILLAFTASLAILINALYLQSGPHPAPIFRAMQRPMAAREVSGSASTLTPLRANEGAARAETSGKGPARGATAPVRNDPIAELIAPSPKRVIAVQHALAEYGYGQLKATGVVDAATKASIEKFERERRLPITGQISDRLMRELGALTGRSHVE
jgi:hypothetical protein